ncbi:DUF7344 domain-containing protein [Halobellus sp. GM3]|uniref:DUF7344 domain-containing protein n=1 Tax=Halobellus sp. GM3 TaxID=3458410 RepID=UPI00403D5977
MSKDEEPDETENNDEKENTDAYDGLGTADELPLFRENDIFYLLSQHRKRAVVLTVAMAPWDRVHLRQLAEVVSLLEADADRQTVSTKTVTNTRTNLKRSHLDVLVNAGIVQWDDDETDVLTAGPAFGCALTTLLLGGYSLGGAPADA